MCFDSRTLRLLAAVSVGLLFSTKAWGQKSRGGDDLGGALLVAARRTAIDDRPFQRTIEADKIRQWMDISSRTTIAEFELFLAPLTPKERQVVEKIARFPAPIVNRLHFEDLRAVLRNGQLSSYFEEERIGSHLKHTTPALENELYGAYDCVFASIGPPDGSPRYGDVVIRLRDSVRENGWATPFSGMHFLYAIRHQDARAMQQILVSGKTLPTKPTDPLSLGFDDRLHFSHYVVTEGDWNKALAYQAILVLRNADASPAGDRVRERFSLLLQEDNPERFWKLFIPPREPNLLPEEAAARVPFGYLEGKFDNQLSIEDFTSIEVPADKLSEVLSWPEARPYRELIRAKAGDVL
jgi:hypothetical protein